MPPEYLTGALERIANACTGRRALRYGERERPEHRSKGLLINAQVAHAPRTVPEISPLSRTCNRNTLLEHRSSIRFRGNKSNVFNY